MNQFKIILIILASVYAIAINVLVLFASIMSHLGDGSGSGREADAIIFLLIVHIPTVGFWLYPLLTSNKFWQLRYLGIYIGIILSFIIIKIN